MVVELERALKVQAVVVPVVPDEELVLRGQARGRALLGLERAKRRDLALAERAQALLKVVQELQGVRIVFLRLTKYLRR
jgi:hypothetical protein